MMWRFTSRRGFTLTEILIVLGLVVLLLAIAVPSFNLIRGSRSVESAENQISALIGRARSDALGLQKTVGIMFFLDPVTERINVAEVVAADYPDAAAAPIPTRDVYLDVVSGTEYLTLPPGV